MDRIQETSSIVKKLNLFFQNEISRSEFIKSVCSYFDTIKEEQLSEADLKFLRYLTNISGIPHYYEMLKKFNTLKQYNEYDLNTFSALLYESTLHIDENIKIHRYQKEILNKFQTNQQNKFFLSASTSFGKTFLVYEIIKKINYKNIVLIFPTIALLTENYEKLLKNNLYDNIKSKYTIHTLSDIKEIGENNIFIYTPERYLSFIDNTSNELDIDFVFVDEIYKIDNEYIIDNINKENERDTAYRIALYNILQKSKDILLVGPYINFPNKNEINKNQSFNIFLEKNNFKLIDYNSFEIVNKSYTVINKGGKYKIDPNLTIDLTGFSNKNVGERLSKIVKDIRQINENVIIYTKGPSTAENKAKEIIQNTISQIQISDRLNLLITHLENRFQFTDWSIIQGLKNKIGIHHGLVPKYIQKEIISLFNNGDIDVLISTTTITEGVNTSAKNLLVLSANKGNKPLKTFDAKNIAGRAGRFLYHYSGRVLILEKKFQEILESSDDEIKHKNYDKEIRKDEIDYFITDDEFLDNNDKIKKEEVIKLYKEKNIPDDIMNMYKVISYSDKIDIFDRINLLISEKSGIYYTMLQKFISKIAYNLKLDYNGFEIFLWIIKPIVKNEKLKFLIDYKVENNDKNSSLLTNLLYFYLKDGFIGSVRYKIDKQNKSTDEAIRESSSFVFNTLKYQLVKYLGVFNIMYKFIESQRQNKQFDEITGIDKLLVKLEYNATSEKGKLASDYGVPSKIIEYYDNENKQQEIKSSFDGYELEQFKKIEGIVNE
jgi:ERCC4-related helicase